MGSFIPEYLDRLIDYGFTMKKGHIVYLKNKDGIVDEVTRGNAGFDDPMLSQEHYSMVSKACQERMSTQEHKDYKRG